MSRYKFAKAAKDFVRHQLLTGQPVVTADVKKAAGMDAPQEQAIKSWENRYVRNLVHAIAKEEDVMAMSLGPGQGHKIVQTDEERRVVEERARAQLAGQSRRAGKCRKEVRKRLPEGQQRFDLDRLVKEGYLDAVAAH